MGKVLVMGAGGGTGSDECTAARSEVLKGYTAVTRDSDDEAAEGTLELTGTAADSQVLEGKTYYNVDAKNPRTGNMKNNGEITGNLNCGQSMNIPSGFTTGGTVTAAGLAGQTPGNATAAQIVSPYTAWVNGAKVTGGLVVNSVLSFSAAAYSTTQILLQWQVPYAAAGKPFSGVFINYSTDGYPGTGGTRIYTGVGNNVTPGGISQVIVNMPTAGTGYYFSLTPYCSTSAGELWGNTLNAYAATTANGQVAFTSSGNWTVPAGVRAVDLFGVGGGECAGGGRDARDGGNGGSSGRTVTVRSIVVSPGEVFSINIGAGGVGNRNGGTTTIYKGGTALLSANGGSGFDGGGSGGGWGGYSYRSKYGSVSGAADGGSTTPPPGCSGNFTKGQGYTTRAFGEAWNTLYAGGGGGGVAREVGGGPGAGGAGGGGGGSNSSNNPGAGGAGGTGSGGGGGYGNGNSSGNTDGGPGAGGIALIRW